MIIIIIIEIKRQIISIKTHKAKNFKEREGGAEAERWRDFYMHFLII